MIGWLFSKYLEKKEDAEPAFVFGTYTYFLGLLSGMGIAAWIFIDKICTQKS